MAKNFVFEKGNAPALPVIAGTVSGSPVTVGMLPGVAETSCDANGNASVRVGSGVFSVSVTGAIATVGLPVYITSATQMPPLVTSRRAIRQILVIMSGFPSAP